MVSPQMPTGTAVREAVLHHQAYRQTDNPMGVTGLRRGQARHVGVERLAAPGAAVDRIGEHHVAGTPGDEVSQIVQRAFISAAAPAALAARRTATVLVDAAVAHPLRLREIFHSGDPLRTVRYVFPWPRHKCALPGMFAKVGKLAEMAKKVIGRWTIDATVSRKRGIFA